MALRIDEYVIKGEIDNRTRGKVTGKIWFTDRKDPVLLNLTGNAWRDLAGWHLTFENPAPKPGTPTDLFTDQTGVTGDITASRKCRIPEVPIDELYSLAKAGLPYPWHWGNTLYLEWFSRRNGRVVIESADYKLTISPDRAWTMTKAEEKSQLQANQKALHSFMEILADAVAQTPIDDAWPETKPETESQARTRDTNTQKLIDRILARLKNENPSETLFEQILLEEITRARRERNEPDPSPEQLAENQSALGELNAAAANDPSPLERQHHPIAERAMDFAAQTTRYLRKNNLIPDGASSEHPLICLIAGTSTACVKLSAVIGGHVGWPPPLDTCADTIIRLQKSAESFADALLAIESCREENLAPAPWLDSTSREISTLTLAVETLIQYLRHRLQ